MTSKGLPSESLQPFETYELPTLKNISPSKHQELSTVLKVAGNNLVNRMKNLREGGIHVDSNVIADREPMVSKWSNNFFVLDPVDYSTVLQQYDFDDGGEGGCYLPESRTVLIKHPERSWSDLPDDFKTQFQNEHGFSSILETQNYYINGLLNTAAMEEFVHRLFGEHIIDQHLTMRTDVDIDPKVISFFNESMTKVLVGRSLIEAGVPRLEVSPKMTSFIERLPEQNIFEIVFFGSNDADTTVRCLSMIQTILLEDHPGHKIDEILEDNGYFKV